MAYKAGAFAMRDLRGIVGGPVIYHYRVDITAFYLFEHIAEVSFFIVSRDYTADLHCAE
jgi:hypothetical protein